MELENPAGRDNGSIDQTEYGADEYLVLARPLIS
jgi:hypothetical protein